MQVINRFKHTNMTNEQLTQIKNILSALAEKKEKKVGHYTKFPKKGQKKEYMDLL